MDAVASALRPVEGLHRGCPQRADSPHILPASCSRHLQQDLLLEKVTRMLIDGGGKASK